MPFPALCSCSLGRRSCTDHRAAREIASVGRLCWAFGALLHPANRNKDMRGDASAVNSPMGQKQSPEAESRTFPGALPATAKVDRLQNKAHMISPSRDRPRVSEGAIGRTGEGISVSFGKFFGYFHAREVWRLDVKWLPCVLAALAAALTVARCFHRSLTVS